MSFVVTDLFIPLTFIFASRTVGLIDDRIKGIEQGISSPSSADAYEAYWRALKFEGLLNMNLMFVTIIYTLLFDQKSATTNQSQHNVPDNYVLVIMALIMIVSIVDFYIYYKYKHVLKDFESAYDKYNELKSLYLTKI